MCGTSRKWGSAVDNSQLTAKFQSVVLQNMTLENAIFTAMSYLNLGEIEKAQNLLQGAMLDSQLSKGASNGNAAAAN